jgi:catechol 2,3-dioxygenase-like lactoylglutathione lyase family enzyme
MPRIDGLNHITLTVTDLDRSREWYESVLGFRTLKTVEVGNYAMAVLGNPESKTVIALTRPAGARGGTFDEMTTGLDHLSFAVPNLDELKGWKAHLERLGIAHSPVAEDPFGLVLVFRDPDDIQLELFAPTRAGATTGGAVLDNGPPGQA